jgi:BlaI family penicillinase repressor
MDQRLTRYELELMNVLWKLGEGTVQDVCDNLGRDLAYTTVMTTLSLLERKKRVLKREKVGRAFVYRPLVSREEVQASVVEDLRGVLFDQGVSSLVLSLLASDNSMSRADINAIRAALKEVEQKNSSKRQS